tara:strand:+ start:406 stop:771 length:366 start_codon:yes stop_codon:yes gene_type:complete
MAEFLFPLIPDGSADAITVSGTNTVISVTNYLTKITGENADDKASLPAGLKTGQLKKIQYVAESASGDDVDVTLTNAESASLDVIRMTTVGDYAICQWTGSYWKILELGNETGAMDTPTVG